MYKRIFAVLLLSLFLLVSCSLQPISVPSEPISTVPQNAASESETPETTKAPETKPADLSEPVQFDNRALNSGIVFLETEEKFFGMMRQEYIFEADPDTGECAYLCTKEGCDHMRLDCEARIGETEHGSLGFYEGKLYWIGTSRDLKAESVQAPKKGIWRIDPDGSGRELVRELETAYYYFQQAALYDGSYYLLVRNARPTLSGSVTGTWDLWRIPLGAGEAVRIFQMELDPDETWNSFRISSGALYFKTDINPADTQELSMKIVRISLPDGESEVLYEGKRPGQSKAGDSWWVDTTGKVFCCTAVRHHETTEFFCLEGGNWIPETQYERDWSPYTYLSFSDGILIALGFSKKAKEETGSAYYIAVLDREGKVLYEGPIPVLYRKDRDDSYHIESYFGDSKDLYFVIYDGLGKDCTQVLLRYELTEDGLTEHVIWEVPTPSP